MSDEGLQPQEELTLEGAWVFIDDNGSDVSDEVEEAQEMVETDEEGEKSSVSGGSANDDPAIEETAEESSDHEVDEHSEEDDDSEGVQGETNDDSEEEQNVANVKKKGKAARVVKGLKKLMGGVFRPSGAKLKLDVDLNLNLKASYGKHLATNTSPKAVASSSTRTKTPKKDHYSKQNVEKEGVAKSQRVAGPQKAQKKLIKIKRKPDEVTPSKPMPKEPCKTKQSSSITDVQRIAKLIAENERLRQRNRILIHSSEPAGCREMDCICRMLKLVWNASGAKLKWNFNLNIKLNVSNEWKKSKKRISTARKKRHGNGPDGKNDNERLKKVMDENDRAMSENKRLRDEVNDLSKTVQQLTECKANINKMEKELEQLREQSKPSSSLQSQSSQPVEDLNRLLSELGQARLDATQMEEQHKRDVEALCNLKEELAASKKYQESLAEEMLAMKASHQCGVTKMFETIKSVEHEKRKVTEELQLKIDKLQTELDDANEQKAGTEKSNAQLRQKFHDVVIEKNLLEQYIDKNIVRERELSHRTENTYILEGGTAMYSCAICKERFTKFACWHTHWMSCYMRKPSLSKAEKM